LIRRHQTRESTSVNVNVHAPPGKMSESMAKGYHGTSL
jgi:hypothetical protein